MPVRAHYVVLLFNDKLLSVHDIHAFLQLRCVAVAGCYLSVYCVDVAFLQAVAAVVGERCYSRSLSVFNRVRFCRLVFSCCCRYSIYAVGCILYDKLCGCQACLYRHAVPVYRICNSVCLRSACLLGVNLLVGSLYCGRYCPVVVKLIVLVHRLPVVRSA